MNEQDQQRKVRHRIAVLRHAAEVTGNVAQTCRYYGISRPTFYRWLHQWEELGEAGLRDTSSKPHHCPHQTSTEVVEKIMYLRSNYHFGPQKISMYLKRYHDVEVSKSGVWRILNRLASGLPALQASRSSLETVREAAPGPPSPDRRQVHRTPGRSTCEALLPVHSDR